MAYEGLSKYLDFSAIPDPGSRFKLGDIIATGTYAEVREAVDTENDDFPVAIKMTDCIKENLEEIEEEHLVLSHLSAHDNFPKFYGTFLKKVGEENDHQIWFVMEYMTEGPVSDLSRMYHMNDERMSETLISYILREIIQALIHLHSNHVIHRDIKGMNILITDEGRIKLVDFGQCARLPATMDKRNTAVGTPYWMAPEVIECEQKPDHDYDNRADIWALGITAIELADGDPPYADIHPVRALFQIIRNPPPALKRSTDWTHDFVDFIAECLVKTPDHRPVVLEIVEHPFIAKVPEDTTEVRNLLLDERQRLTNMNKQPSRPPTGIAREGYIKTDRRAPPKKMIADDLAALEFFNEEVVLENLYARWNEGHIYTWMADVLLVINPFSEKCKYDEDVQEKYKSKVRSQNDPHIFAVADRAHQNMMHHKEHQTIVLTGESGSGKTFNFYQLVNQLCYIGSSNPGLIYRIKEVCTVLDAFGNAVTLLNSNATRHSRYFDITFSRTGKVSGAIVWLLMLDKYRVTERARGEGNFHMFYYLYDGLSQSSRLASYGLKPGRKYHYLAKHAFDNEISNAQKFYIVEEALQIIGFQEREIHSIYLILAAILNIGNIKFTGNDKATIVDMEPVKEVCRLLDVDEKKLSWALCNYCQVKAGQEIESAKKSETEAEYAKEALARTLYSRVVDFIVNSVNGKLTVTRLIFGDPYAIGVLDMFGFEANDHNTLENLLVNVANEQVQYYYNQYIFNWEMQDYNEEGIPTKNFTFPDNRHILELFLAKNNGFFAILEDESRDSHGNDDSLACQLKERVNPKKIQPVSDYVFAISHYVGRVKYDIHNFVHKNRDHISVELIQTMRKSANEHLRSMFFNKLTKTGNLTVEGEDPRNKKKTDKDGLQKKTTKKDSRKLSRFNTKSKGHMSQTRHVQTLGMNFRYSLIEMLYKLTNSQPHFVRCIRSNMDNSGTIFDREMIKHQIKYHAVCDTIRIRQQGFSHRIPYQEFLRRYQFLAFNFDETVDMTKDNARLLLVRLKMEGWAIGKDKVFLKYYNEEFLSRLYESSVKKIVKIQALIRAFIQRKKKKNNQLKATDEDKNKSEEPKRELTPDEAAIKIQSNYRGYKVRQEHPEIAAKIKSKEKHEAENKSEEPKRELTPDEAATKIQSSYRGYKVRQEHPEIAAKVKSKEKHGADYRGYKAEQEHPEIAEKIKSRDKFGEATLEEEAVRYVQYYYRKWKMRSLLQQLQIYRADKQQHLVYFSQEVHLYSQELQAKLHRLNGTRELSKVRNEAVGAHKTILRRAQNAQPKLALDHMLTAYFDTTFLCDPGRAKRGRQQDDDWEAPFKSRDSASSAANTSITDVNAGGTVAKGRTDTGGNKSQDSASSTANMSITNVNAAGAVAKGNTDTGGNKSQDSASSAANTSISNVNAAGAVAKGNTDTGGNKSQDSASSPAHTSISNVNAGGAVAKENTDTGGNKSQDSASSAANMNITNVNAGGAVAKGNTSTGGNTPSDVKSKPAMLNQGKAGNNNEPAGQNAYNRFAGSGTPRVTPQYNKFVCSSSSYISPVSSTNQALYMKPVAPRPKQPPVMVNSWENRQFNGYSDNNYEDESQGTHDFRKHLRKTNRAAMLELEAKATGAVDDEGTFNFQDLLSQIKNPPRTVDHSGGARPRSPKIEEQQHHLANAKGDATEESLFNVQVLAPQCNKSPQTDDNVGGACTSPGIPITPKVSPVEELQQQLSNALGGETEDSSVRDESMLRKTNHSRGSLKRDEEEGASSYYNANGGHETSTFTEETEEAML